MGGSALHGFAYRFVPATREGLRPLLLLHGTGGDESDLLPIGEALLPGAALLSPRGKVLESGMPRFFGRLAEGVFDLDEVRRRALDLGDFITEARAAYDMPPPIAVGYSNGANVAAALMILRPGILGGAILLRAMAILDEPAAAQPGVPVLMVSGARDPIIPVPLSETLAMQLRDGGAVVEHTVLPTGHQLTRADIDSAKTWIASLHAR